MYNDSNNNQRQNNRAFAGLFLVILGGIYLLRQMDFFFFPSWLFSWPLIFIIIGVLSGIKHNFRQPFAYIMIFLGSLFLLGHIISVSIYFFWPIILIAVGVSMLMGRNNRWNYKNHNNNMYWKRENNSVDL
ncbi:hypothetical protein BDD43_0126 [Mucilaginibacter gracilis]|uniref:LiaF transmembrane domain-containing protein n=1 Tax=Mucilaginibacter gracilis TaxID=423350 RepID=A0A495ITF2_9SPHI|nr:DUF5668 domain-containing protein [Mucilaginibacter gracilis]RKR80037.1 hypothetical protein BDD43_0126 [Mucilaginibacter gracilis]